MPRYLAMLFLPALLIPTAAVAHSNSVEASPADGAQLESLPTEAKITFDTAPTTADVALTSPDGTVTVLTARVDGSAVVARLPSHSTRGTYQLSYRVVSADGHPVSGTTTFTVTAGSKPSTPKATPPPAGENPRADRSASIPLIVGLVAAFAALVAVTLAAVRARRR